MEVQVYLVACLCLMSVSFFVLNFCCRRNSRRAVN